LSILEAGHGLLDELGRLLVDGRTSYCGLGETGSDRRLKSRASSFRDPNNIRGKRSVCSREISRRRLDGTGIGIWSDQTLGVGPELTYRLVGSGRFQAPGPSLGYGNGKQRRTNKCRGRDSGGHGKRPQLFVYG
jgi:hypothetical protein